MKVSSIKLARERQLQSLWQLQVETWGRAEQRGEEKREERREERAWRGRGDSWRARGKEQLRPAVSSVATRESVGERRATAPLASVHTLNWLPVFFFSLLYFTADHTSLYDFFCQLCCSCCFVALSSLFSSLPPALRPCSLCQLANACPFTSPSTTTKERNSTERISQSVTGAHCSRQKLTHPRSTYKSCLFEFYFCPFPPTHESCNESWSMVAYKA